MSAESIAAPHRESSEAGLLLGSNIDPQLNLPAAVRRLGAFGTVTGVSSVWQTAPVGFLDQADFCNAAVLLETKLKRDELRRELRVVEESLGRARDPQNKNAPRTIDIDIVLWTSGGHQSGDFDPEVAERLFVATPLAELYPDLQIGGVTLIDIARRLHSRDATSLRLVRRPDIRLSPE